MSERVIVRDGPPRRSDPHGHRRHGVPCLSDRSPSQGWLAFTAVILNADAAPPLVNASILPLLFLSGIFIPLGDQAPHVDAHDREPLPGQPFADALFGSASSDVAVQTPAGGVYPFSFVWSDLTVVADGGSQASCSPPASSVGSRAGSTNRSARLRNLGARR